MDAGESRQRRGGSPDNVFLVPNVFHRGPYDPPSRSNLSHGVQLLLRTSISKKAYNLVEIDHEIISKVILLSSAESRRVVVSYKRKYVHEILHNCLAKLVQVKSVVSCTEHPDMAIAVDWRVKLQTKQTI